MTSLLLGLLRLFSKLPLGVVRAIGALLGLLLYALATERRRVALINLALCFPDWTESRHRQLARQHFRLFTKALLDRGLLWWGSEKRIHKHVRWSGLHHYEEAARQGPVILLAPHFVGLDAGGILATMTWRIVSVYSHQKDPRVDAAALAGRSRFNEPLLLSRQDGMRAAVRAMKEGLPFYYLPDMDFGARDAVFIPFFAATAATITAVPRLARLAGARVVPCVSRMTRDGYEVKLYPAWENYPGDDVTEATRRMNAFIEERVLEMPEQYFWLHKRFKTRPPGEKRYYK